MDTIRDRLNFLMVEKGLNSSKLAKLADISTASMSNIVNGKNGMSKKTAEALSASLGVNIKWLLEGEGEIWVEPERVDLITKFAANAINQPEEFKSKFIEYIAELDEKDWAALERMAKKLVEMQNKQKETSGE